MSSRRSSGRRQRDRQKLPDEYDRTIGDTLLSRLLRDKYLTGRQAYGLLEEFQGGYPLDELRVLFKSEDKEVVRIGIFIISELGAAASPLGADIVALLNYPDVVVRGYALDWIMAFANGEDGFAVHRALDLVEDSVPGIRSMATQCLARVPDSALRAAFKTTPAGQWRRKRDLELLIESVASGDAEIVISELASTDATTRRYAAAAAARMAIRDPAPLQKAVHSEDPEVKDFALHQARQLGIHVVP